MTLRRCVWPSSPGPRRRGQEERGTASPTSPAAQPHRPGSARPAALPWRPPRTKLGRLPGKRIKTHQNQQRPKKIKIKRLLVRRGSRAALVGSQLSAARLPRAQPAALLASAHLSPAGSARGRPWRSRAGRPGPSAAGATLSVPAPPGPRSRSRDSSAPRAEVRMLMRQPRPRSHWCSAGWGWGICRKGLGRSQRTQGAGQPFLRRSAAAPRTAPGPPGPPGPSSQCPRKRDRMNRAAAGSGPGWPVNEGSAGPRDLRTPFPAAALPWQERVSGWARIPSQPVGTGPNKAPAMQREAIKATPFGVRY